MSRPLPNPATVVHPTAKPSLFPFVWPHCALLLVYAWPACLHPHLWPHAWTSTSGSTVMWSSFLFGLVPDDPSCSSPLTPHSACKAIRLMVETLFKVSFCQPLHFCHVHVHFQLEPSSHVVTTFHSIKAAVICSLVSSSNIN